MRFGKDKLNYLTEKEYYEGKIDPKNGADWNQAAPIDSRPKLEDFKKKTSQIISHGKFLRSLDGKPKEKTPWENNYPTFRKY